MDTNDLQHGDSMWKGDPMSGFSKAQSLRANMTEAEIYLWNRLKLNQFLELKFRRQHPIGIYIVDFYCHQYKLIIEVDGDYHLNLDQIEKDKNRSDFLSFQGLKVVRFSNEQVINKIESVLDKIEESCKNDF
jgi:very-short-patch-repair endonuclease